MKELEALERLAMPDELHIKECKKLGIGLTEDYDVVEQALLELQAIKEANPSEALECLEALEQDIKDRVILAEDRQLKLCAVIKQALQRLDKYEQILGNGRLTDRNYKNTTLDLDNCKPYLRLGQLEDIYEEGK